MTALYIIGSIVAIILLLLFLPLIRLRIDFDGKLDVYLRIAFFKIMLFPQNRKKKKKAKSEKAAKEKPQKAKSGHGGMEFTAKDIPYILESVSELISDVFSAVSRKLTVKIINFHVKISTGDAANTALIYGAASAAANAMIGIIDERGKLKVKRKPQILCDFTGEKTEADVKLAFILSAAGAIAIIMPVVSWTAKFKTATKNNNDDQNQIGQSSGKV